jgi:hypothetical protein
MSPQRSDLILSTHIPNIELDIFIRDGLHVESHRRNRRDILIQLQLVENRRLARSVETQHQKAHFLRSEDLAHHLGYLSSHCGGWRGGSGLAGRGVHESLWSFLREMLLFMRSKGGLAICLKENWRTGEAFGSREGRVLSSQG